MAITKRALDDKSAIWALVGAGAISVPLAMAWLGHSQADLETSLDKDKDFKARERELAMYDQALNSLESTV